MILRRCQSRAYSKLLRTTVLAIFTAGWAQAQASGYFHTSGNQILDSNNQPVRLAGVNWYGFETSDEVVHGLWAQDYKTILNAIKSNGYNTIRLPFSNQMVETPIVPSNIAYTNGSGAINSDLSGLNALQIMDKVIAYAGQIGLRVILDNHRSSAGSGTESGLWYTSAYPQANWLADWKTLVMRYLNNSTVIGIDLRNEPHDANSGGSCWGCGTPSLDWRAAAQSAGTAMLGLNPHLLIFVEGTDCTSVGCDWWGGNLSNAQAYPINLPNQLVYSAHEYGPNLYVQTWFNSQTTPASLVSVWTQFWAYLSINGIAPVWIGEFGTTNTSSDLESSAAGSQGQWFQSLIGFLSSNPSINWTYWALNGEDSYSLLDPNYDPTPASPLKQQLLASIQPASSTTPPQPGPVQPPSSLSATAVSSSQINLTWTASTTSGATYNVYASTVSSFAPSSATRVANNIATTSFQQQGLQPSTTYYYLVTAVSGSTESSPSNQASAATPVSVTVGQGPACQVSYSDSNDWGTGFRAAISITNTSASATISSWSLTWTWAGNQQITQSWSSNFKQNGAAVTLTNASWNGTIAPGASVTGVGFNGSYTGSNAAPAAFSLNGVACSAPASSPAPSLPVAPTNLAASAVSSTQVSLTWKASTTQGVTYNVYESTSQSFTPSASNRVATGLTSAGFEQQNLSGGTAYYYMVTALNSSGESVPSKEASATTPVVVVVPSLTPPQVNATAASSSQINLAWSGGSTGNVTYNVYSSTAAKFAPGAANRIATGLTGTSYQNTGLSASTTYYYYVTVANSTSESAPSNEASATTPAAATSSSCHISYTDQNDWGTGFTGSISITNTGSITIQSWSLTWTWPGNQQITSAWNATSSQKGNSVTFSSMSYNGSIAAGATLTGIGFNANYSGTNAAPATFSLNGMQCK
jgi:endoglucanase